MIRYPYQGEGADGFAKCHGPHPPDWLRGLFLSIPASPDLFRDLLEYVGTITPVQTILERPEVVQRLAVAREAMKGLAPPAPPPGPSRGQLLQIVA